MEHSDEDGALPPCLAIDAGSYQWRIGWTGGDEINAIIDASAQPDLASAFAEVEAAPDEHAVLLSEPVGTSASERIRAVSALFGMGVQALYVSATPLLPLYHFGIDTGIIVDIGERKTTIWPVFEGHPVLGAAAILELGGWHLTRWLAMRMRAIALSSAAAEAPSPVAAAGTGTAPPLSDAWLALSRTTKEAHARVELEGLAGAAAPGAVPGAAKKGGGSKGTAKPAGKGAEAARPPVEITLPDEIDEIGLISRVISLSRDDLARCGEALFQPPADLGAGSAQDGAHPGAPLPPASEGLSEGLGDAIWRVLALCDYSLRGTLLGSVVLVGGGSMLEGLPERLLRELQQRVPNTASGAHEKDEKAKKEKRAKEERAAQHGAQHGTDRGLSAGGAPLWAPRVLARGDRRYACWLGSAVLGATSACAERFVRRAEYLAATDAQDDAGDRREGPASGAWASQLPSQLTSLLTRWGAFAGCSLLELEAAETAKHAAAAAAAAASEEATRARLRAEHEETRRWWMEMAPVHSALERQRQWRLQRLVVLPMFEAATAEVLHGASSSRGRINSIDFTQRTPPATAPRVTAARSVPPDATLSAAALEARRQCADTAPWRLAARASSLASLALGTASGDGGGEWESMCRVRMRLCARWAADVFESPFDSAPSVHVAIRARRLRAASSLWSDRAGKFARAARRGIEVRSRLSALECP